MQTNDSNPEEQKGDPNRDVQPWLGWVAALLVVVIVVVAVAMGMARTNSQRSNGAEIRMTPLVGGKEMPVATGTGSVAIVPSEVTPAAEAVTSTSGLPMVTVITTSNELSGSVLEIVTPEVSNGVSATAELTATGSVTSSSEITPRSAESYTIMITEIGAVEVHLPATTTETVTGTSGVTVTAPITVGTEISGGKTISDEASITAIVTATVVSTATVEPTATATAVASPTVRPTATMAATAEPFDVGDQVVARAGRVELYAESSADSPVLESYGANAQLEVLDPDGDDTTYPVMADGESWLRVRAADGLVGWVKASQVEAE